MRFQDALGQRERFDGGDPDGMVYRSSQLTEDASTEILCKDAADLLETHYPGHVWMIGPDPRGGIFTIRAGTCSGEWGYILKLDDIQWSPNGFKKAILKAGGEILERFGLRVGAYDYQNWLGAPRDATGMLKPDISDKDSRVRRKSRDEDLTKAVKQGDAELGVIDDGGTRHVYIRPGGDE